MDIEKAGIFIAELRKNKNLTQLELGNLIGTSCKAISKWENGNGFPELSYQKPLCEVLEIDLEELHNGELNVEKRKQAKRRILINRIFLIFACVVVPLLIFFSWFFVDNFNSFHYYQIDTKDNSVNAIAKGMLIKNNNSTMIYIGNITLWNHTVLTTDIINVEVYSGKSFLYRANVLENIWITLDENVKIDKDNLMIKVTINTMDGAELIYGIQLNVVQIKESENKLITLEIDKSKTLDNDIEINLTNAGFKQNKYSWTLEKKNKSAQINVDYFPDVGKISYHSISDTIIQNFVFFHECNQLDVYIYHKESGQDILFEKYTYNYSDESLNCQVGVCSSLNNVLKTMESYINLLSVDI